LFWSLLFPSTVCHAAVDWMSFTWDNDIFVGEDNGYTNGGFWTWFNTGRRDKEPPEPSWLQAPLLWSMSDEERPLSQVNAHTIGHMMVTPEDIKRRNPDPNDIPYSGLLYYENSHMEVYDDYADLSGVTIGLIGPSSGAGALQKFVHKRLSGSDIPQGWHAQLKDEVVFRLTRNRVWREWASPEGGSDFLLMGGANLGTLETSVAGYAVFRWGRNLAQSYAAIAYHGSRAVNPMALNGGWHIYLGLSARYVAHLIFTDGNTFHDGPSIDADPSKAGYITGFSYSWSDWAATLAIEDMAFNERQFKGIERYGTLTVAYRFK
jgi:lipid A 3-O-deacylase